MSSKEPRPVLITAQTQVARLEAQRDEIAETLAELVETIQDLRRELRAGQIETKGDKHKALTDLRYWLKAARDTELELDAIRRKQSGIEDVYGLDLDAAVAAVACRLAQLRPCCGAGEDPE